MTFVKIIFSTSIIFKVKSAFEINVFKLIIKKKFISSNHFSLLIINVRFLFNFQKEWCTFGRKNNVWKKKRIVTFKVWVLSACKKKKQIVSIFEHMNFAINEKYSKSFYDNLNYYVSLVIYQTYKNAVLKSVHSLGSLLWFCFYPHFI
jgi:hypothetical protein